MKFGTIFYEKVTDSKKWYTHYEHLMAIGIQHLELTCHETLLAESVYKAISTQSRQDNIQLSFHVPHFCDPQYFDLGSFQKTLASTAHWESYFKMLSKQQSGSKPSLVIAHGASDAISRQFNQLPRDATLRFFDWALHHINQFHPELSLGFENTCLLDGVAYGQTENDLQDFLSTFNGAASLGLCFDLAHYVRNQLLHEKKTHPVKENVNFDFIDTILLAIEEIHLHGFSPHLIQSHLPLMPENDCLLTWLRSHQKELSAVPVVCEMLTAQSPKDEPEYLQMLVNTFKFI